MTYQDKKDAFESTLVAGPDNSIGPDTLRGITLGLTDQLNNDIAVNSQSITDLEVSHNALQAGFDELQTQIPYNHTADADPTANDDGNNTSGNGVFSFTSKWLNSTSGDLFICESNSTGAAVWVVIDYNGAALGALALLNTVGSAQIDTNAVGTNEIAPDAVTPVELEDTAVTPGSYTNADITVDAQGRITSAADGSAAGVWTEISKTTISSAVSSVDFTNLSGYRFLRLTMRLVPATDDVSLYLRMSTNNGSTYDSGSKYDYGYSIMKHTVHTYVAADNTTFIRLGNGLGSAANEAYGGQLIFYDFNQSNYCHVSGHYNHMDKDSKARTGAMGGAYQVTTACDAFRLLMSSGNIESGYLILEGAT